MEANETWISNSSKVVVESFLVLFCHFVDFPKDGIDCLRNDSEQCVQCRIQGAYFTGESINDGLSIALVYYIFLWSVTVLLSLFAILANIIIIRVINKSSEGPQGSFQFSLVVLAYLDAICSVMAIISSTGFTFYLANWFGRGEGMFYWCFMSLYTTFFFRSISTYITVLISIKGFLLITFPIEANIWFTHWKTVCLTLVMFVCAIVTSYPRFVSWTVEPNPWRDVESLQDLEYIVRPTDQGTLWYETFGNLHNKIDFLVPLPLLLLFNVMSFWKVRQLSERRKEMRVHTRRNIRAVRMFLPVVIVYLIANIGHIANSYFILVEEKTYREFYLLTFLSLAINSAVNLPIYYFRNKTFREEARKDIVPILVRWGLVNENSISNRWKQNAQSISINWRHK